MVKAEESKGMSIVSSGKFKFDPRLLDHFSVAMYKDARKAISELVANSYDAGAKLVQITIPQDWYLKSAKVVVKDNGKGMSPEDIKVKFLVLGYNKREDLKGIPNERIPIGNKGIGKLAGLGIAQSMNYNSTKDGNTSAFSIDRSDLDDEGKSLEEYEIPINSYTSKARNGTAVELFPLHDDIVPATERSLREFLAQEFPIGKDFQIEVNDVPVTLEQLPGEMKTIDEQIENIGSVTGWYKILDKPTKEPGFSVRVRGRIVKNRSTFSIGPSASKSYNYAYIIGDVKADFLDPIEPKSKIEEFTIATDREGFNEASPAYMAFQKWAVTKLKAIAKDVKEIRDKRAAASVRKNKSIKKSINNLPDGVREQTELLINRLIEQIPWEDEEEIIKTIKAVVESVGSSETLIVLRELANTDANDVSGFANLIERYGLADLWKMGEYITGRLQLIREFERLVTKRKTMERKEMHPMLENNIWLLKEDYVLMGNNEQMKTVILRETGKPGVKETVRPDLICKSRKKSMVIIELKGGDHVLKADDIAQVWNYVDILKRHFPNTKMEAYMIGGSCETSPESMNGNVPVVMTTYPEVLDDAKDRYEEFIRLLPGRRRVE